MDNEHGFHGGEFSRGVFRCPDPECRCDVFYRHGTYPRYFVSFPYEKLDALLHTGEGSLAIFDMIETQYLSILRIRCTGCGQTHAILPSDIVPFHAFSLLLQLMILHTICYNNNPDSQRKELHQSTVLSWPFLNALLTVYQAYRSRMCHVLRQKNLYLNECIPSDYELLMFYLSYKPDVRSLFLHVFSTQLFLTRHDTVPYPLRIIVH